MEFFPLLKRLAIGAFVHALLVWAALAISYNGYKSYLQGKHGDLSPALKTAIKETFPVSILIFVLLYVLYDIYRNKDELYSTLKHYSAVIILYTIITNALYLSRVDTVLLVNNFSIICIVVLLVLWSAFKWNGAMDIQFIIPPCVRQYLQKGGPVTSEALRAKLRVHNFVIYFFILLMFSAFFILLGFEKYGKELVHVAYFLLLIKVVGGMLGFIWFGAAEKDE